MLHAVCERLVFWMFFAIAGLTCGAVMGGCSNGSCLVESHQNTSPSSGIVFVGSGFQGPETKIQSLLGYMLLVVSREYWKGFP